MSAFSKENIKRVRPVAAWRRPQQQGSALLVVLVLAAIIAIMLYRELPIAAFEAQRQREELLVSRGNEYKRAVKLFVRKIGRFPGTIDELENTNRMRFLRHRFVDPMTGKDNWRLIHAGPGGIIIDSKIATKNSKNSNALGQGATFSGFNNSFSGDNAATAALAAENTPSAGMRQRPPATKNAGAGLTADPLAVAAGPEPADSNNPNGLNGASSNSLNIDPATGQPLNPNGSNGSLQGGTNNVNSLADQLNNTNPRTPDQSQAAQNSGQNNGLSNTSSFGNPQTSGSPNGFGNNGFGNSGVPGNAVAGNQGLNTNQTTGGGIAGVASIAPGKGIKLVHDQKKYSLWEFYYDMRAEQQAAAGNALGQTPGANGIGNPATNNTSAFGNNSSFGSNSAFGAGNGFGQSQSGFGGATGSSFASPVTPGQPPTGTTPPQSLQPPQ